jgi:hypothetical protein
MAEVRRSSLLFLSIQGRRCDGWEDDRRSSEEASKVLMACGVALGDVTRREERPEDRVRVREEKHNK